MDSEVQRVIFSLFALDSTSKRYFTIFITDNNGSSRGRYTLSHSVKIKLLDSLKWVIDPRHNQAGNFIVAIIEYRLEQPVESSLAYILSLALFRFETWSYLLLW